MFNNRVNNARNSLPDSIVAASSIASFKKTLMDMIFQTSLGFSNFDMQFQEAY
jgi:hypothetical protein